MLHDFFIYHTALSGWAPEKMLYIAEQAFEGIFKRDYIAKWQRTMNEKAIGTEFIKGASDLVGVALVCGLARAANMLLTSGKVSDTLLYTMSGWVEGMNPILFIITMMLIFVILGFFVASTSGLAILSIPIMAPLADAVGLPRELIISAFLYGQGLINLITPTNIILPVLSMTNISYDKYLKWVAPLFFALAG